MPVLTDQQLLEAMIANDQEPTLSADTVATLLANAATVDPDGLYPEEDDWTPTYNLNVAAARGWRLKAARVAADYDLDVDGKGLSRSQMVEQFLKMASAYARLGGPRVAHLGTRAVPRW